MSLRDSRQAQGQWHGSQLKTEADLIAHRSLCQALAEIDPGLPIVSEEDATGHGPRRPRRYWLIDPIDGTASLAGGFDGFVTQAALIADGIPQLAAIHAPALDLLYLAERGRGATCNQQPLRVTPGDARRVLIDNTPTPQGTAAYLHRALDCTGYLESGSISLKMCRVADGAADLFVKDVVVRDWDVAAPALLLAEAGAVFRQVDGSPYAFSGDYEKPGLVCASSDRLAAAAVAALGRRTEPPHEL